MADAETLVVDASIALSWCFEDEHTALGDAVLSRLLEQTAVAPGIWPLEVANGLRSAERRERLDEHATTLAAQLLMTLPITVDETPRVEDALGRVLHLARSVGLTTYDAAYLDLALRRGLPLATVDDQLARAAVAVGVDVLEVA